MSPCKKIGDTSLPFPAGTGYVWSLVQGTNRSPFHPADRCGWRALPAEGLPQFCFVSFFLSEQQNSENKLQLDCSTSFTRILLQSQDFYSPYTSANNSLSLLSPSSPFTGNVKWIPLGISEHQCCFYSCFSIAPVPKFHLFSEQRSSTLPCAPETPADAVPALHNGHKQRVSPSHTFCSELRFTMAHQFL